MVEAPQGVSTIRHIGLIGTIGFWCGSSILRHGSSGCKSAHIRWAKVRPVPCATPRVICKYVPMSQQPSSVAFFDGANTQQDFTVVLRGFDREQVNAFVGRLNAQLAQSEQARAEAEQRMNDAQRRLRQAEQRLNSVEQKLT